MASYGLPTLRTLRHAVARPALASLASTSRPAQRRRPASDLASAEVEAAVEEEYSNAHLAGMGSQPFSKEAQEILTAPINEDLVELRPDGQVYMPAAFYRQTLNRAFGPGGWAMMPNSVVRREVVGGKTVASREWTLVCLGRPVSVARGYHDPRAGADGLMNAEEAIKSNALMRCCKDLGIANELWSRRYVDEIKKKIKARNVATARSTSSFPRTAPSKA